jgi:hypothetical protein
MQIHKEKTLKNKKNFITVLIITAIVVIIGGWSFLSPSKKTYNSFTDIFKTMDISTKNRKANIAALEKFSKEKNYTFQEAKDKNISKILVTSKDYIQNLIYSPEENALSFIKMNGTELTMPDKKKIKNISKEDSFDKVIDELGEPDTMHKNENGLILLKWADKSEKGYIYLTIELEDNKVTEIRNTEI